MTDFRDSIIDFADKHLQPYELKKKGDGTEEIIPEYCPFCHGGAHGDKKSFALSVDYGVYVCKRGSCGQRGRFDALFEHFGEKPDEKLMGSRKNDPIEAKKAFDLPEIPLFAPTNVVKRYFEARKIGNETLEAFKIASDAQGNVVFPFYENGQIVFEKFRRPEKPKPDDKRQKEWRVPNTKAILFGLDMCVYSKPLVITEGQIDCMSLYEAGVRNVVSVPSGCEDFSWVEHCWDQLEKFKSIIFFGDDDEPGRKMVREAAHRLDESRCLFVENYPVRPGTSKTCKDANEILYFYGGMKLIQMVEDAREAPIRGLINLGDAVPSSLDDGEKVYTRIPALDKALKGLRMGAVTVWSGKSGYGKSTLTGLLTLQAIEQGYNVCVYSGELTTAEFQTWIDLQCAGSDYIAYKTNQNGEVAPYIPYDVQQAISAYYNRRLWLYDNQEIFEDDESTTILKLFTAAYRRYDCRLFVVDNLMMALADSDDELRDQKRFVNKLKKFARKYNVHVMVVAHPRKTKKDEKLDNQDIAGSMAVGALADATLIMERPNIRIVKNRITGQMPLIECAYCPDSRRIYQLDSGDKNHFSWNKTNIPAVPPEKRASALPEFDIQLPITEPF